MDSETNIHPLGLTKTSTGKMSKSRRWVLLQGLAPPSNLGVFNDNLNNGHRAFAERYYRCKVGDKFEKALGTNDSEWSENPHMIEFLERVCDHLELSPILDIDEVVDQYKGYKKKVYERAAKAYWTDGIRKMDAQLRSFVKFEKCALDKAPRVINPRSPVFNLFLGQWLKQNEHRYFEALARAMGQDVVVLKGYDVRKCASIMKGMWDRVMNCVGIGGDASKFDMHVSKSALFYEHLMYIRPYCSSLKEAITRYRLVLRDIAMLSYKPSYNDKVDDLCWALGLQLDNAGKAYFEDGTLKFKMEGTRASGDLNTSLGNCIIMTAMTYCWSQTCKVPVSLVNNGDDCQYFIMGQLEEQWREGFKEFYARKGFRMVLEDTVHEFEEVEFCQSKPVRCADGYRMVRNPRTLIIKGSMCLKPVTSMHSLRKWVMAIGVAEGALGAGVPVIESFARALRRNGRAVKRSFVEQVAQDSGRMYHEDLFNYEALPITAEARLSFFAAFGILPDEQIALERHYDTWTMSKEFGEQVESFEAASREAVPIAPSTWLLE